MFCYSLIRTLTWLLLLLLAWLVTIISNTSHIQYYSINFVAIKTPHGQWIAEPGKYAILYYYYTCNELRSNGELGINKDKLATELHWDSNSASPARMRLGGPWERISSLFNFFFLLVFRNSIASYLMREPGNKPYLFIYWRW